MRSILMLALFTGLTTALPAASPYTEAHRAMVEEGCPTVVLVGADWCPACQKMKDDVIPQLKRQGVFEGMSFATVDVDREGELAQRIQRGRKIPQLVLYRRTAEGWRAAHVIGARNPREIAEFIEHNLRDALPPAAPVGIARATDEAVKK